MTGLSVAIMAGGKSSRMGTDKAFVPLLGKPLIAYLLASVATLDPAETVIITNRPEAYAHLGLPTASDLMPGMGPLGGIYTALHTCVNPDVLVLACDVPFTNPALLAYMASLRADRHDIIVPVRDGHPQGLQAIYHQRCAGAIRDCLEAGRLKVIAAYERLRVRYLDETEWRPFDPDGLSFLNVNTPADLALAAQSITASSGDDQGGERG